MTTAVSRSSTMMPRRRRAERTEAIEAAKTRIPPSEIANRAYELFVQRGRTHGHDVDDWLVGNAN
jgi:hypothetical protein